MLPSSLHYLPFLIPFPPFPFLLSLQEVPRGHPDCLTGKTFVISGVLDSLKREEAADFVKRHGGKVGGCGHVGWVHLVVCQEARRKGGCACGGVFV